MNINAEQNPLIKGLPQEKIDEILDVMSSFKKDFEEILNTKIGTETRKDQNEKKMGELKQKMAEKKKNSKIGKKLGKNGLGPEIPDNFNGYRIQFEILDPESVQDGIDYNEKVLESLVEKYLPLFWN